MNVVVLGGNLTADPELRYTQSGTPVVTMRIAVSGFGERDEPLFINVTAWEKLADICAERLRKGNKVVVHGSLKPESWTAADGSKRSTISVRATSVEFMHGTRPITEDGFEPEPVGVAGPKEGVAPRAQTDQLPF